MDPTEMDDKLYYVEGPDAQVLGPMNMIHILEGIAAGAVPDDARICEVGAEQWINLEEVAYTRDPEPKSASPSAASSTSQMRTLPLGGPEEEPPASARPYGADPDGLLPESAMPYEVDPADALTESAMPNEGDPADALPESAKPYEEATAGASDFALEMQDTGDAEPAMAHASTGEDAASPKSSRKWVLPVVAGVMIPLVAGIYFFTSGRFDELKQRSGADAPDQTAQTPVAAQETPADAGWRLLRSGDVPGALRQFKVASEAEPENARVHHGFGVARLQKGDAAGALRSLEQAKALQPDDLRILVDLGSAQMKSGQADEAFVSATDALALSASDRGALRLMADVHSHKKSWSLAIPALAAYVKSAPNDEGAQKELAVAFANDGRLDSAVAEITKYLDAQPTDWKAQETRLEWMISTGHQAEATATYGAIAAANPKSVRAQTLAGRANPGTEEGLAFLRRAAKMDPSGKAGAEFNRAQAALSAASAARNPRKAAAPPTAVVAAPKTTPLRSHVKTIRGLLARDNFTAARNAIDDARRELAGDDEARTNLDLWTAICTFQEGQPAEALELLHELPVTGSYVASGFGSGTIANWSARVMISSGNVRGAVGVLDQVGLEDADEYAQARLWEGVALASLGMDELALRTWQRVPIDVGTRVTSVGLPAVRSAEFLSGAISESAYISELSDNAAWKNDMHYFLGYTARRADLADVARDEFHNVMKASQGREFPYYLAEAEIEGRGLTGEW